MTSADTEADWALKARHRAMWAAGDYAAVAARLIPQLGRTLVEACRVGPGQRVLDVAAGTGNAAVPAALAGADVVACDLTPELLDAGRAATAGRHLPIRWDVADAEDLPYRDAEFDVVLSCVGVMFAPHHQNAARELLRVCRPGGTVGLVNWTPEGFIGELFATMRAYVPPPPPGVQSPTLWGSEAHVRELLSAGVLELTATRRVLRVDAFTAPREFREFFKTRYGPTVVAYLGVAHDPARVEALDRDLDALAARYDRGGGVMDWEYLLVTAVRGGH